MGEGDAEKLSAPQTLWDPNEDSGLLEALSELEENEVPVLERSEASKEIPGFFDSPSEGANAPVWSSAVANDRSQSTAAASQATIVGQPLAGSVADSAELSGTNVPLGASTLGVDAAFAEQAAERPVGERERARERAAEVLAASRRAGAAQSAAAAEIAAAQQASSATSRSRTTSFSKLLTRYIGIAYERQLAMEEFLGDAPWALDLAAGTVSFGDKGTFPMQLLGSVSETAETWLWAWANQSPGIVASATHHSHALQEKVDLPEFQAPVIPLSTATGHALALTISGMAGGVPYHRGPFPGGAVFFLVSGVPLSSAPDITKLPRVLTEVVDAFPQVNCREMVEGLFTDASLKVRSNKNEIVGSRITKEVVVTFDVEGRIARVNLRPTSVGSPEDAPASPITGAPLAALKLQKRNVPSALVETPEAVFPSVTLADSARSASEDEGSAAPAAQTSEPVVPATQTAPPTPPIRNALAPLPAPRVDSRSGAGESAPATSSTVVSSAAVIAGLQLAEPSAVVDSTSSVATSATEALPRLSPPTGRTDGLAEDSSRSTGSVVVDGQHGVSRAASGLTLSGAPHAAASPVEPPTTPESEPTPTPAPALHPAHAMARAVPGPMRSAFGTGVHQAVELNRGTIAGSGHIWETISRPSPEVAASPSPEVAASPSPEVAEPSSPEQAAPLADTIAAGPAYGAESPIAPHGLESPLSASLAAASGSPPMPSDPPGFGVPQSSSAAVALPNPALGSNSGVAFIPPVRPRNSVSSAAPPRSASSGMRRLSQAKPERDHTALYTAGIVLVALALVAVLLLGMSGDGAKATVRNLQLTHDAGRDAVVSYDFSFQKLPEDTDSVVIRLASPAFTTPVLVPWDVVSDVPPSLGASYSNGTSIDAALRDQVTQREAVVSVSIESGGHSAGRERIDIRELYDFAPAGE